MVSILELNKYQLPQINNIPYEKYKLIWYDEYHNIYPLLNKYYEMNNYDKLCKYILNFGENKHINDKFIIPNDINFLEQKLPLKITKLFWFKYIIDKINMNENQNDPYLIISTSDKIISQAVYLKHFKKAIFQLVIKRNKINLIIYNPQKEIIVEWITQ
jgi:hypothetical protein